MLQKTWNISAFQKRPIHFHCMEKNRNKVIWVWNTMRVNNLWQRNYSFNQEDAESHWNRTVLVQWQKTFQTHTALTKCSLILPGVLWPQTSPLRRKWKPHLKGDTSWDWTSRGFLEYRAKVEEACWLGFPQSQQGELCWGCGVRLAYTSC